MRDDEAGHAELSKDVAKDGSRGGALKHVASSSFGFGDSSLTKVCLVPKCSFSVCFDFFLLELHCDASFDPFKSPNMSTIGGANELSKFSDTPGDASLEDLFQPVDLTMNYRPHEASSSRSTAHVYNNNGHATDAMKNDLAAKLRATIAQKRLEKEMGQSNSGGKLLRLMIKAWKDDVIDIDGLV